MKVIANFYLILSNYENRHDDFCSNSIPLFGLYDVKKKDGKKQKNREIASEHESTIQHYNLYTR